MKDVTLRNILIFVLFITSITIAIAVMAMRGINRSTRTSDWVNHTHAVLDRLDSLSTGLLQVNATLRAYVAIGETSDQIACNDAIANMQGDLELIRALTRQESQTSEQVEQINALANQRIEAAQAIINSHQNGQAHDSRRLLTSFLTSPGGSELYRKIKQLREAQLSLLSERDTASYMEIQSIRWIVWLGVVVNFLFLVAAGWLIHANLATRRRAAQALAEANTLLEIKVAERTSDLTAANEKLSLENIERQWANQALEHQLHYNHNIVESISDLVLVLTKSGNITRANQAILRHTGWELAQLIKHPISKLVQLPSDQPSAKDPLLNAMKEGRDLKIPSAMLVDHNGSTIAVQLSLYPLRDQNKVIGGIVTLQIIPPRSEAQS